MAAFASGEGRWIAGLGNLRNTIRQEMIRRQLTDWARPGMTVLDVGCGQGTQAIRLAQLGCIVAGVEPSASMTHLCAAAAATAAVAIELLDGSIEQLDDCLADRQFDLVCAHGVLMYLPDRAAAITTLARRVAPGGLLSITFRNGHALAMRPALRRDWTGALAAFESRTYVNEIGVTATADLLSDVERDLSDVELTIAAWYGVRVFNDAAAAATEIPADEDMEAILDAEDQAGRRDPYRWMASQFHVVARHHTATGSGATAIR